jgi:hypothetical protein
MPYRNDHEALRGRVRTLEGQLREAREQLELLRTPSPDDVKELRAQAQRKAAERKRTGRGHRPVSAVAGTTSAPEPTSVPATPSGWKTVFQTGCFTMLIVAMAYLSTRYVYLGPLEAATLGISIAAGAACLIATPFLKG